MSKGFVVPSHQGALDGLCGMYAIVNAMKSACTVDADQEDMFKTACNALSRSRWPKVLWDGTSFGDLRKMIHACVEEHGEGCVSVRYPFLRSAPRTNEKYWAELEAAFKEEVAVCAIIGITGTIDHWTAIVLEGKRVFVLDSTAGNQVVRRNRASLSTRRPAPNSSRWQLDRREVALFYRT